MMNNFIGLDTCNRRNLDNNSFPPIHVSVSNYSTNAHTMESMKDTYNTLFFNNLHMIPDPLKKNLADSVITDKDMNMMKTEEYLTQEAEKPSSSPRLDIYPRLRSIVSGVMGVMGAMFQWRGSSPPPQYYDCFDNEYVKNSDEPMSGSVPWQAASHDVQNNNGWSQNMFEGNNESNWNSDMITDCNPVLTGDQINEVCLFLNSDTNYIQIPSSTTRKSFEPGSADIFEDACCPEEFSSPVCNSYLEYHSPSNYQEKDSLSTYVPNIKTDEVKQVQKSEIRKNCLNTSENIVTSCEDKLNKIKALLKCKSNKQKEDIDSIDIHGKVTDDTVFGNEIKIPKSKSIEICDHFNEVTGKFYSSSVESDDSFQIVFTDDASECRRRIPSECESEDSFIVFEESPDGCYITDDIFGDENDNSDSDSDTSDSEDGSDRESTTLFPNLSLTVEDLTDDMLYNEDAVDGSIRIGEHYRGSSFPQTNTTDGTTTPKIYKQVKKVRFSSAPPKVHVMRVWAFAAKRARMGEWEQHGRDRERFKSRINDVEMAISWVLKPQHRKLIMFQRFMPWWNAQKRQELEEKKELQEREKLKGRELVESEPGDERKELEGKKEVQEEVKLKKPQIAGTESGEKTEVKEKTQVENKRESTERKLLEEVKQFEEKTPDETIDLEKTERKDEIPVQEKSQSEEKIESVIKEITKADDVKTLDDVMKTEEIERKDKYQSEEKIESVNIEIKQVDDVKPSDNVTKPEDKIESTNRERIQPEEVKISDNVTEEKNSIPRRDKSPPEEKVKPINGEGPQLHEVKPPDNVMKPEEMESKDTESIPLGLIAQIRQNSWDEKDETATEKTSISHS